MTGYFLTKKGENKMSKKYKIELQCSDERERDIIFDIISEHELIPTLYRNHSTVNEEFDIKELVVLSNELVRCLYTKLSGRVSKGAGWTSRAFAKL
tara:strand:- start:448 stop:735 length:288 start_codon:yes stop_codon:yes gene_type:complete